VTAINSGLSNITASQSSDILTLTMDAGSDTHQDGWGRSFEIVGGTALSLLFLTAQLVTPSTEIEASFELLQPRDDLEESDVVGGEIAFEIGRDDSGSCTAATVAISSTEMTLTQTGATPASYFTSQFFSDEK
jgi:hypothetical protein